MHPPLAIIGFGNMGTAILEGAIRARIVDASRVLVAEPDPEKQVIASRLGAHPVASAADAAKWLHQRASEQPQLLLAIKPQMLAAAAESLQSAGGLPPLVVISILAGTPSAKVRHALGDATRVIRAMPNLPASIGQGATAACLGAGANPGDDAFARQLFKAIGPLVVSLPEELMDSFTAIAGSGPAYLFYLAEAMTRAAREQGFAPDDADSVVRQTLLGAAELLSQSSRSPSDLRAAVTSRGGTTAAATQVLDQAHAMDLLVAAMNAARDRGRELASM